MGGVLEVMVFCFGIFIFPAKQQKFIFKIAKELFMAKTKDPGVYNLKCSDEGNIEKVESLKFSRLKNKKNDKKIKKICHEIGGDYMKDELLQHHVLRLSKLNSIKLYFAKHYCCCFKSCSKSGLVRLYDKSSEKVDKSFDIIRILKNMKYTSTLVKNKFLNDKDKFLIEHNQKNLIHLDSVSSEEAESSCVHSHGSIHDHDGPVEDTKIYG